MELTKAALGMWSGGRAMHFGLRMSDEDYLSFLAEAHGLGLRTLVTADVYGMGESDEMVGQLFAAGVSRDETCLVGCVGHDFYHGQRNGAKGFPRFTDPALRSSDGYYDYLRMAVERSLERCRAQSFDLLLLHNPDLTGYTSDAVWLALARLRDEGLTRRLGIAPGPANGFTLDIIRCFERFGGLVDWAMIILSPLEPWPGLLCLGAARKYDVKILTRVVDCGGLFHDDVRPGHRFAENDHRLFRPAGWVEAGCAKIEQMRPYAERHGMTLLQLACVWNLSQSPVASVVPTLIQEPEGKPILEKARELASLPDMTLPPEIVEEIRVIGDNTGCMPLKGASVEHLDEAPLPDRWGLDPEHLETARRWRIDPARDLIHVH